MGTALLVLGLGYVGLSYSGFLHAGWDGMLRTPLPDPHVTAVVPGGAGARAGIAVGDRLDYANTPAASRYFQLATRPAAGTPLTLSVIHRGVERQVHLIAQPIPRDPVSPWKRIVAALLMALAGTLLILRPQRATWAFMAYAAITTVSLCNQYLPYPLAAIIFFMQQLLQPLAVVALLYFSVWFLHDEERRWHRPLTTTALALGLAYALLSLIAAVTLLQLRPLPLPGYLNSTWEISLSIITLLVLVEAYVTGRRAQRQKIAWVVSALAFALVFYDIVPQLFSLDFGVAITPLFLALYACDSISPLVVAAALLYAMTQYRVIDLRFAVSRAVVYGVMTALIVGGFAFVEWVAGRLFEGANVAAYAGLIAAVCIAFAVNTLSRRVERFVDSVFFRRQQLAFDRLRHVAISLLHTDAEPTIVTFLVNEPVRTLDLASSALFLASGNAASFVRAGSYGWPDSAVDDFERTDEIVPQLRAATAPLLMEQVLWRPGELPGGVAAPMIAVPLKARGDLFGVVFYGAHTDGAALNSEERELLSLLAFNAASAYDHIEAAKARTEIADLRLRLQLSGNAR